LTNFDCSNGFIRTGDVALYYEIHSSPKKNAPFLILLHGNGENLHIFDDLIKCLIYHCSLITMDTRHHGRSSQGTRDLSYELFAEDLFAVVNELHIGLFMVLGFSDGAITALEFAIRHSERLSAMVLVGANISPAGLSFLTRAGLQLLSLLHNARDLLTRKRRDATRFVDLMLKHPNITCEQLSELTVPALVVHGEFEMIKSSHSALIASSLPQARRVMISGASHFVMKDRPLQFERVIMEFLQEVAVG